MSDLLGALGLFGLMAAFRLFVLYVDERRAIDD